MLAALRFLAYMLGATGVAWGVYRILIHALLAPLRAGRSFRRLTAALCAVLPAGMLQLLFMRETPRWLASPLMALAFGLVGVLLLLLPLLALAHALALATARLAVRSEPRRDALRTLAALTAGALTLALSGLGLATALEAPGVRRLRAHLRRWPASRDGYRIVQLSDLHVGPTLGAGFVRELVAKSNALDADLIVLTGDLVDGSVRELGSLVEPLRDLRARDGVFFVTGNHEYLSGAPEWIAFVRSLGITVLRNEHTVVGTGDRAFVLAGTDDDDGGAWHRDHGPDLARALTGVDPAHAVLLLAHRPTMIVDSARRGVDLQLSGHTHGGQIRPLDLLEGRYAYGAFVLEGTALYVTSGAGYWGPPMRVATRSEIPVFELYASRGRPRIEPNEGP